MLVRTLRLTTKLDDFVEEAKYLLELFRARGYKKDDVKKGVAKFLQRNIKSQWHREFRSRVSEPTFRHWINPRPVQIQAPRQAPLTVEAGVETDAHPAPTPLSSQSGETSTSTADSLPERPSFKLKFSDLKRRAQSTQTTQASEATEALLDRGASDQQSQQLVASSSSESSLPQSSDGSGQTVTEIDQAAVQITHHHHHTYHIINNNQQDNRVTTGDLNINNGTVNNADVNYGTVQQQQFNDAVNYGTLSMVNGDANYGTVTNTIEGDANFGTVNNTIEGDANFGSVTNTIEGDANFGNLLQHHQQNVLQIEDQSLSQVQHQASAIEDRTEQPLQIADRATPALCDRRWQDMAPMVDEDDHPQQPVPPVPEEVGDARTKDMVSPLVTQQSASSLSMPSQGPAVRRRKDRASMLPRSGPNITKRRRDSDDEQDAHSKNASGRISSEWSEGAEDVELLPSSSSSLPHPAE